MPVVRATPTQFLLTGRQGRLVNRGSAVQVFLRPGTVYVLVPSARQEAAFQFSQETSDGIPLRFKGIVVYRITDPVAVAQLFDFSVGSGTDQLSSLLTHVVLGELRHAVSHMTMAECIEQRKTTLSGVVEAALAQTVHPADAGDWGITIEVAQVAQVFIVDAELRRQLEAETRNEIKLRSDQSDIQAAEEAKLVAMASADRVAEQQLATDREQLRRTEELELAQVASRRRLESENLATRRQALEIASELNQAETAAEEAKVNTETPVRVLKVGREIEVLREELGLWELRNRVRAAEVEHELLLRRAEQELRREILPLEQAPEIVEAASGVFQGANLSIYGESAPVLGQIAPLFEILSRALQRVAGAGADGASSS